jgi:cell shape-determining protein MreD
MTLRIYLRYIVIGLCLLLLSSSVLGNIPLTSWHWDGLLVLTLIAGLGYGQRAGIGIGLSLGALLDLLVGSGFIHTASKALSGYAAGWFQNRVLVIPLPLIVVGTIVITILENLFVAFLLWLAGNNGQVWHHYQAFILPTALTNALLLLLIRLIDARRIS